MSQPRMERRVGLFVLIGLVLLAVMLLQFSKGLSFFRPTYTLRLKATNIGGLKDRAAVLLAGVQVGVVKGSELSPDGRSVIIVVQLYEARKIHGDARFVIEQSGFLGDQYVAIIPTMNAEPLLRDGDEVPVEEPFDLQEVARNAAGFIQRIDETGRRLNEAIADVRRLVLNEQTLTNLAGGIVALRATSERAMDMIRSIDKLVDTNTVPVTTSISNLVQFSERITLFGVALQELVSTNRDEISAAIKNVETSTQMLTNLLGQVQSGPGLAAGLIADERLATSVSSIAQNLSITTSNINQLGLWRVLWRPRPPRTDTPPGTNVLYSPGDPRLQ